MNWDQAEAILWLRWRLTRNGWIRAGALNAILSMLFAGAMLLGGLSAGVAGFVTGWLGLRAAEPQVLLLVWDGVIFAFLVIWLSGLMVEIQRSESIDLGKLLHLPVTLQQVFAFNYLASHLTPAIVLLLPGMIGLCAGLVVGAGVRMIPLLLLMLSFVFMVTAWTYCLRGWLAALMVNKRRRRTIIVWITVFFILVSQVPNLLINSRLVRGQRGTVSGPGGPGGSNPAKWGLSETVLRAHLAVPPGWVGYGALEMRMGNPWPGLGAALAAGLLGGLGLMRAYRMTVRFYQGAEAGSTRPNEKVESGARGVLLVERRVPWVAEDTGALALATLRSLLRAPELKMALIMPLVMVVLLGSTQFRLPRHALPSYLAGFAGAVAAMLAVFTFAQAMSNAFGLDRNGFRALVLLPTPRDRILFAKNLAFFPFVAAVALILMIVASVLISIPVQAWVGGLLQVPLAFMLFLCVGGLLLFAGIAVYLISLVSVPSTKN